MCICISSVGVHIYCVLFLKYVKDFYKLQILKYNCHLLRCRKNQNKDFILQSLKATHDSL